MMLSRARAVTVLAVAVLAVGFLAPVASAQEAPPTPALTAVPLGPPTSVLEGTKGPGDAVPPALPAPPAPTIGAKALGDVTITPTGCSADPIPFGGQATCAFAVTNHSTSPADVVLDAVGDTEVEVVGADLGAAVVGGVATTPTITLDPRVETSMSIEPGDLFFGYVPLGGLGLTPQAIDDDQLLNFVVPEFEWNGDTYTSLGISANGYVVVGGGDVAKDATAAPQNAPDPTRPNNVLAPFWTDLVPGALWVGTVSETGAPPCSRLYFLVVEWGMTEFGTTTDRSAQLWIRTDDPDCATDAAPPEAINFTYDLSTMTAAPARPFRIAVEDATGTEGAMRPAGELPTSNHVVSSSGTTVQPGETITWNVVVAGRGAGVGTVEATVTSSVIPGSSTVSADVTVEPESPPVVTDDPDDTTVTAGQQAVFTAAATGYATVRWEVQAAGGGPFTTVPGATGTTLAFPVAMADDGERYRAVFVTGSGVETPTADALLTVVAPSGGGGGGGGGGTTPPTEPPPSEPPPSEPPPDDEDGFVERAYVAVLGRPADDAGLAAWQALLEAGTVTQEQVVAFLAGSVEGRTRLVAEAYEAILDRPVDPAGAAFWAGRLAAGAPAEELFAALLGSDEAWAKLGADPAALIGELYRTFLGREPGPAELETWLGVSGPAPSAAMRYALAVVISRAPEAAAVAALRAAAIGCTPPPSDPLVAFLVARWAVVGHNPRHLAGDAVAACVPG